MREGWGVAEGENDRGNERGEEWVMGRTETGVRRAAEGFQTACS